MRKALVTWLMGISAMSVLSVSAQTAASAIESKKQTLYSSVNHASTPYRIPAVATLNNGTVLAIADQRPCGADVGNGEVDIYAKVGTIAANGTYSWNPSSTDPSANGGLKIADGTSSNGYGDAAVVVDRESGKVLVICVSGKVVFSSGSSSKHNKMARIIGSADGLSWQSPEDVTSQFFANELSSAYTMFMASGRMIQSQHVKVGDYYRIYGVLLVREKSGWFSKSNNNYVVYSDDFGASWKVLGGTYCLKGGDEAKVEELPNGDLVISSRTSGGRYFNVFKFTNLNSASGSWGSATKYSFGGSNSTNGELMLYKGLVDANGTAYNVMLQSLPTGSSRSNVAVFYKAFAADKSSWAVSDFTSGWTKGIEVDNGASGYSTMTILPNGQIGFLYEDDYDTSKASGDYSNIVYVPLTAEEITGGAYNDNDNEEPVVPVAPELSLKAAATTLTVGGTTQLTLTTNSDGAVTYKSSNTAVATVNNNGVVTAVAAGTAIITANVAATEQYNAASATATITVNKVNATISLSAADATLTEGETTKLTVSTNSTGAVTYKSSNTAVATVDSKGVVTAVAAGTATITASVAATEAHTAASATCAVTVKAAAVAPEFSLSATTATLTAGQTTQLTVSTNSTGAVTYKSSNTAVATVNNNGVVTAVAAGTATITASVAATEAHTKASATCAVTVKAAAVAPTFSLSATTATLTEGETTQLTLTTNSDGAVTYKSSNTAVATVNNNGVVTAVAAGTATITANVAATEAYTAASATCAVTVESAPVVEPEEPETPEIDEALLQAIADAKAVEAYCGVGYPSATAATRTALASTIANAEAGNATASDLATAVSAFKNETSDIQMPEEGKTYTFANVAKDGTKRYFKYASSGITAVTDKSQATQFTCEVISSDEYAFVTDGGQYLIWKGPSGSEGFLFWKKTYGYNSNKGYVTSYNSTYCDLVVEKLTDGGNVDASSDADLFGLVCIKGMRYSRSEYGYFTLKGSTFDASSDPYYNSTYSSAFLIEDTGAAAKARARISEETTAIEEVEAEEEFTIQNSELIYDLMGRRVTEMKPGQVYIVNGKKVLVKE